MISLQKLTMMEIFLSRLRIIEGCKKILKISNITIMNHLSKQLLITFSIQIYSQKYSTVHKTEFQLSKPCLQYCIMPQYIHTIFIHNSCIMINIVYCINIAYFIYLIHDRKKTTNNTGVKWSLTGCRFNEQQQSIMWK